MEAVAFRAEVGHLPVAFRIQQQAFRLKVLAAHQKFPSTALCIFQHPHRLPGRCGRISLHHTQRFLHMQFPMVSVFIRTFIIVQTVGQVGTFLNLCDQHAGADGMHRARFNVKHVVLLDRHVVQIVGNRALLQCLPHRFFADILVKPIYHFGLRFGGKHVPQFRLAQAVFMGQGIGVIRMHLHRKVLLCVNELQQDWQLRPAPCGLQGMGPQIFRVRLQHFSQKFSCLRSGCHHTGTVRMGGALPGLRQGTHFYFFAKIVMQSAAAPQVIFRRRLQQKRNSSVHVQCFAFLNILLFY